MPIDDKPAIRILATDDLCPPGGQPFNPDHCTTALDMRTRIATLERGFAQMQTAFTRNDLGEPDYDGHRVSIIKQKEADKIVEGYKLTATTKVIGVVVGFLVLLLSSGLTTKLGELLK